MIPSFMPLVTNNTIDGNFEEEIEFKASSYPNNRGNTETIKDHFTFYGR